MSTRPTAFLRENHQTTRKSLDIEQPVSVKDEQDGLYRQHSLLAK
jgi:hypothetical protein